MKLKYKIYAKHKKKGGEYRWEEKGVYSNRERANNKLKKSFKKLETKIVPIPEEFHIGMKIYGNKELMKGSIIPDKPEFLYGTILEKDESFFYVSRSFVDDANDLVFYLQSDFEDKFVEGRFFIKEEDYLIED